MPLYRTIEDNLIRAIWKLEESPMQLAALLPEGEKLLQEAQARFRNERRIREWMGARVLLYTLLGELPRIAYHANGRPEPVESHYALSISHTDGYVAVALYPDRDCRIGIDIEQRTERAWRLRERFMGNDEGGTGDEKLLAVLHWSAKETLFKMMESEEVDFKEHLHIEPFTVAPQGVMKARECKSAAARSFRIGYQVEPTFVLTWGIHPSTPEEE